MEFEGEDDAFIPVSPTGQYLKSSILSLYVLAVLEFEEVPLEYSEALTLLKDLFLPINPRFSAVMVGGKKGARNWKQVQVKLEDHVVVPKFPDGKSPDFYNDYLNDYLAKLYMDPLPEYRPLWEIHLVNFPTSNAAGSIIFKLHHALGDGYSLMGALLSCLKRVDDPSLPLTFPSRPLKSKDERISCDVFSRVPKVISGVCRDMIDFGSSILISSVVKDEKTPIRSDIKGSEFKPKAICTMSLPLDQIKKSRTILMWDDGSITLVISTNDVITGVILLGTRLYMEGETYGSGKSRSTALVLLNTRNPNGYNSINEMVKPNSKTPWGNYIAFLHLAIPKLGSAKYSNPLYFVEKAHQIIKKKRNSIAVYLVGILLETLRKYRGPDVAAKYLYGTMENTSLGLSSLIGPSEQMTLASHKISGLYYLVAGPPGSLQITMINYLGKLRISLVVEKDFVDQHKLKSCIEKAYQMIFKAATNSA